MLSPEARAVLAGMAPPGSAAPLTSIEEERRGWEAAVAGAKLPAGVSVAPVTFGGVACDVVSPDKAGDTWIVHLHGGGYSAGSPRTHREFAARLAVTCRSTIVLPEYRLAPEHPFPAALEDAVAVYRAIREIRPNVVVSGDSAGGGLAMALLFEVRRLQIGQPRRVVLISPQADLTYAARAYRDNAIYPNPSAADLARSAALYAGDADLTDPLVSPLFGSFLSFPPTMLVAGGNEVFVDDARQIAEKIQTAGGSARLLLGEGLWHAYPLYDVPEAGAALTEIAAFVDTMTS